MLKADNVKEVPGLGIQGIVDEKKVLIEKNEDSNESSIIVKIDDQKLDLYLEEEVSVSSNFLDVLKDEKEIIELANQLASEHLSIASEKKVHLADKINSAGSIFLGEISSEVLADYVAGPSHVMPTNGSARYSSSLSSRTFQKTIPVLAIDKNRFKEICSDAEKLAKLESLQAHSEAISVRKKNYFME